MEQTQQMGVRRFGRWNRLGTWTLARRETMRFLSIWVQTLAAPIVTAGLFLTVFVLAVGPTRGDVMGVPFIRFIAPGILMMTVVQNAFANSSTSIMAAKMQGSIVDTLMPPLSPLELVIGYTAGATARGLFVAAVLVVVMGLALGVWPQNPLWMLLMIVMGGAILGGLGIIGAVYAPRHDHMAAMTNFVITPLSFLSGTFYSIERLPEAMQAVSHINPFFYLIDGARYGMIGVSDSSPLLGFGFCLVTAAAVLSYAWWLMKTGKRLKP